jgi:GNAT superfamily N-acetyltransferase
MIVATDGAMIVGFGQLDPGTGEVEAVYVLPERQGKGIGQMLLSNLEEQARVHGISRLDLSATLNAADFYQRAGYAKGHVTVHRLPTGLDLPCIRMSKELGEPRSRPTRG